MDDSDDDDSDDEYDDDAETCDSHFETDESETSASEASDGSEASYGSETSLETLVFRQGCARSAFKERHENCLIQKVRILSGCETECYLLVVPKSWGWRLHTDTSNGAGRAIIQGWREAHPLSSGGPIFSVTSVTPNALYVGPWPVVKVAVYVLCGARAAVRLREHSADPSDQKERYTALVQDKCVRVGTVNLTQAVRGGSGMQTKKITCRYDVDLRTVDDYGPVRVHPGDTKYISMEFNVHKTPAAGIAAAGGAMRPMGGAGADVLASMRVCLHESGFGSQRYITQTSRADGGGAL